MKKKPVLSVIDVYVIYFLMELEMLFDRLKKFVLMTEVISQLELKLTYLDRGAVRRRWTMEYKQLSYTTHSMNHTNIKLLV